MAFDHDYWKKNYSDPMEMDGIGNAKEHASYLKASFELEQIDISSIIDFGFGLGFLLKEIAQTFLPYRLAGIEPSEYAFEQVDEAFFGLPNSTRIELLNQDLLAWSQNNKKTYYDLGICTSVFQYLDKRTLEEILPILSQRVKYLYLSFPTNKELKRQREEVDFDDIYAKKRSKQFYDDLILPYFTVVSCRLLESKHYFTDNTTHFSDLYYRF